jgi:hypothetical protein
VKDKWDKLLNHIEPLFRRMTKADDEEMRGESLITKKHVQALKKIIERLYDLMLHEHNLAFLFAMTNNSDSTKNIAEACTVFTNHCKELPTNERYKAINAAMHYFCEDTRK